MSIDRSITSCLYHYFSETPCPYTSIAMSIHMFIAMSLDMSLHLSTHMHTRARAHTHVHTHTERERERERERQRDRQTDGRTDGRTQTDRQTYVPTHLHTRQHTGSHKVDRYTVATDAWSSLNPMPIQRNMFSSASHTRWPKLYVAGGAPLPNAGMSLQGYDFASDSWRSQNDLPSTIKASALAAYDDAAPCIGGCLCSSGGHSGPTALNVQDHWEYTLTSDTWRSCPHFFFTHQICHVPETIQFRAQP